MLYDLIIRILALPVMMAAFSLHGRWRNEAIAPFFHLLPLFVVPGLVLAAPIAFGLEGWAARRIGARSYRALVAVEAAPLFMLLTVVMTYAASLGPGGEAVEGGIDMALAEPLIILPPVSAPSVFGFWLPLIACGLYTALAKRPRWWIASLVGTGALILGVWTWILLGSLVGAQTD